MCVRARVSVCVLCVCVCVCVSHLVELRHEEAQARDGEEPREAAGEPAEEAGLAVGGLQQTEGREDGAVRDVVEDHPARSIPDEEVDD